MNKNKVIDILIIVAFAICIYLPFLKKPYDVDDWATLNFASEVKWGSIVPFACKYKIAGEEFPCIKVSHPPVVFMIYRLFFRNPKEAKEIETHFVSLILFLIGCISVYYFVLKYRLPHLLTSLLIISSPIVLVNAYSLMIDVPTFSFFLCSISLFIYGCELKSNWRVYLSGALGIMGILSSYQAILIIPVIFVYLMVRKFNYKKFYIYSCLIVAIFILWNIQNYLFYGKLHLFEAGKDFRPPVPFLTLLSQQLSNIVYYCLALGSLLVFPPVFFFLIDYKKFSRKYFLYIFSLIPLDILLIFLNFSLVNIILSNVFLVFGIFFLKSQILDVYKAISNKEFKDELFFSFWFILILVFVIIFLRYSAVRYMILFVPPCVMQIVYMLKKKYRNEKTLKMILTTWLVGNICLSLLLSVADYENGVINKVVIAKIRKYKTANNNIWFCEELGLRIYLEKEGDGYNYLLKTDNSPEEGDFIIRSDIFSSIDLHPSLQKRMKLEKQYAFKGKTPIRLLGIESHAGFYRSNWWCLLPFSASTKATRKFYLYKVM